MPEERGIIPTESEAHRIGASVLDYEHRAGIQIGRRERPRPLHNQRIIYVELTSALSAASPDSKTGQTTATAKILIRNRVTGNLSQSSITITVVNRSTGFSYASGTVGIATRVSGEWLFHGLDCP